MKQILIKFIFMLKIHMKQNINCWLQKWKCRFKVFKWLKNFHWIIKWYEWYWRISKILKNTIYIRNENIDCIWWLLASLVIKELGLTVPELFIKGRKLNSSLVFITQSYLVISKNIRLNLTKYFVIKVPNKRELQLIVFKY